MQKTYIVGAKRTAIASFLGGLKTVSPTQMGATVVAALLAESKLAPSEVDELIFGQVLPAGQGQGFARQVALAAGIPLEKCAYSLNMVCGSGLKAVMQADLSIKAGFGDLLVAGGAESMSQAPYLWPFEARNGQKMGEIKVIDHMINDSLTDAKHQVHMGITAENIAERYGISRQAQDDFAYLSQCRAIAAQDAGDFVPEIVPIMVPGRKETICFAQDEYPNRQSSPEKLAKLRPAFKKEGTVTAGNASGINDGAAAFLVASESYCARQELKPLAEIVAIGQGGVDPLYMGLGPVPAIRQALQRAGLTLAEIDILELNEAFAAQSLGVMQELQTEHGVAASFFHERCNLRGGAIALGHPVGASGARILVTLLHLLQAKQKRYGLASLCIGGGMGVCVIVKNMAL